MRNWICSYIGFVEETWVLTILWKWFLVNHFHFSPLSLSVAFGLQGICTLLTVPPLPPTTTELEENKWIVYLVRPLLVLAICKLVTVFM
jgi:hypothetical protein